MTSRLAARYILTLWVMTGSFHIWRYEAMRPTIKNLPTNDFCASRSAYLNLFHSELIVVQVTNPENTHQELVPCYSVNWYMTTKVWLLSLFIASLSWNSCGLHYATFPVLYYDRAFAHPPSIGRIWLCGSDWVFYKLQNDTKNTGIVHSYHKLRSTNCLLVHAGLF